MGMKYMVKHQRKAVPKKSIDTAHCQIAETLVPKEGVKQTGHVAAHAKIFPQGHCRSVQGAVGQPQYSQREHRGTSFRLPATCNAFQVCRCAPFHISSMVLSLTLPSTPRCSGSKRTQMDISPWRLIQGWPRKSQQMPIPARRALFSHNRNFPWVDGVRDAHIAGLTRHREPDPPHQSGAASHKACDPPSEPESGG